MAATLAFRKKCFVQYHKARMQKMNIISLNREASEKKAFEISGKRRRRKISQK